MKEPANNFGRHVSQSIEKMTAVYKNIIVICSKSENLTKAFFQTFLEKVIKPYVKNNDFFLLVDSWGGQMDTTMYDGIFQNANGKVPSDVYFFRHIKIFI